MYAGGAFLPRVGAPQSYLRVLIFKSVGRWTPILPLLNCAAALSQTPHFPKHSKVDYKTHHVCHRAPEEPICVHRP